ncbi:ASCH domain-containing protein [Dehalobacter sp. DCM]|uniref:ASCH domain-containing protein n=1 Tax=Dehalobacter sp. DCM TaxID=2907827 RepID=UPI003081384A|nr:ASCH domain-containing protein [Dehalobacter sp. DCM]
MKAITLWQPWASLLACGAKKYETRSWDTSYRGPIAIHAAARSIQSILKECFPCADYEYHPSHAARAKFLNACGFATLEPLYEFPRGAIIATAELVNCWHIVSHPGTNIDVARHIPIGAELDVPKHHPDFDKYIVPTEQEIMFGNWTPGRYAWEFTNMQVLLEPIPAKGGQRLWNWEGDIDA